MKHYIDTKTGEVFGFEADGTQDEYITTGMKEMSASEYETYQKRPSRYHVYNSLVMDWEITNENKERLDVESESRRKNEAVGNVAFRRMEAVRILEPLQYRLDLGIASDEHLSELAIIKRHIIDLDEWSYPEQIPKL